MFQRFTLKILFTFLFVSFQTNAATNVWFLRGPCPSEHCKKPSMCFGHVNRGNQFVDYGESKTLCFENAEGEMPEILAEQKTVYSILSINSVSYTELSKILKDAKTYKQALQMVVAKFGIKETCDKSKRNYETEIMYLDWNRKQEEGPLKCESYMKKVSEKPPGDSANP